MKPKLIILNGALGVGKTTLATKYADEHPLTLMLDIDELRRWISHYREERETSSMLSKNLVYEMARAHVHAGYDVIISQIFVQKEPLENFEIIARECDSDLHEIFIRTSLDEAKERFIKRGKAEGYEDGFRPGGLVALGGKERKLEQMYHDMMKLISQRPLVKIIDSIEGDIDGTYKKLLACIE